MHVSELTLTPLSPFRIKCKKFKRKKGTHAPQYLLKLLWIMLQYATIQYAMFKLYATSKMELFLAEIK